MLWHVSMFLRVRQAKDLSSQRYLRDSNMSGLLYPLMLFHLARMETHNFQGWGHRPQSKQTANWGNHQKRS